MSLKNFQELQGTLRNFKKRPGTLKNLEEVQGTPWNMQDNTPFTVVTLIERRRSIEFQSFQGAGVKFEFCLLLL